MTPGQAYVVSAAKHVQMTAGYTNHNALAERFPHLRRDLAKLVEQDLEFRQLSEDYDLLIRTLSDRTLTGEKDREEIIALKKSLELEVLDRLSYLRPRV